MSLRLPHGTPGTDPLDLDPHFVAVGIDPFTAFIPLESGEIEVRT